MIDCLTVIILLYIFDLFEGPQRIKNFYDKMAPKYKKLNNMVSTEYKGFFNILFISLQMICKVLYLNIIQYLNNSIIKLNNNKYEINYVINGKIYKFITKIKRGPKNVLLIYDENQNDVSDDILPYLGPAEDFHNIEYTPSYFNKNELFFELSCGNVKRYEKDKIIVL